MTQKVVVIGAVAAGPKAAVRVKRLDLDADVTLVDQDSLISYGGCGIPYYVSGDVADEKELRSTSFHMLRDEHFFEIHWAFRSRDDAIGRCRRWPKSSDRHRHRAPQRPYH